MFKAFFICGLCVAMAPNIHCGNTASEVCRDTTGFNCLYTSNKQEMINLPVYFDQALPHWLTGTLVRNGNGQYENGDQRVTHVFDGFAKLSSWKFFPNGTTVFSTRFVQSESYQSTAKTGIIPPFLLFAPRDPSFSLIQKEICLFTGVDNMNVNILRFNPKFGNPKFGILSDAWNLYEVAITDLSTVRSIKPKLKNNFHPFNVKTMSTAHPLPEPGSRNYLTFLVQDKVIPFTNSILSLVRMTSISGRSVVAEWTVPETIPYMHSFSVSQSKAILLAGPYAAEDGCFIRQAAAQVCLRWLPRRPTTLYIADFRTGSKHTIQMEAVFVLHHINAYELNRDEIIMDVVAYDQPELIVNVLLLDIARDYFARRKMYKKPKNLRIHVNLRTKEVTVRVMNNMQIVYDGIDLPTINENYRSNSYCFVYGITNIADSVNFEQMAILKKNMCKGGEIEAMYRMPFHYPEEPVFVANPRGVREDDGVLVVPVLRGKDAVNYLAVIDARTMTLISSADLPTYIPFSFHGHFFKDVF